MPILSDTKAGPSKAVPLTKNGTGQKKGQASHRMTDDQWEEEVQQFLQVAQNASATPERVRTSWKTLRQNYARKFHAIIYPSTSSEISEPFPLWAAETFDNGVLDRVLRIEFGNHLVQCTCLSLLRSTAGVADVSMWHLILYFGTTVFSEARLRAIRKRILVFTRDADATTWPFTDAYKSLLRRSAVKQGGRLNSTTIPCGDTLPMFSGPELFKMAPNQEFQLIPQTIAKISSTGITGIPFARAGSDDGKSSGKGTTTTEKESHSTAVSRSSVRREQGQKFIHSRGQRADKEYNGLNNMHPPGRAAWSYQHGKSTTLPQNHRYTAEEAHFPRMPDTVVPSIERPEPNDEFRNQPFENAGCPTSGRSIGDVGQFESSGRLTRAQRLDRQLDTHITSQAYQRINGVHAANIFRLQREVSINTTAAGTPFAPKRSIKKEDEEGGPFKRRRLEEKHPVTIRSEPQRVSAHAFEKFQEWDDVTILQILRKLEAIRSGEVTVVDGLKCFGSVGYPSTLTTADVRKGTILVPMKLSDGCLILAVLHLGIIPLHNPAFIRAKQGRILLYDSMQSNSFDFSRYGQLAAQVSQLLRSILPSYDADPGSWDMQYCAMPRQQTRGNTGVALCLAAICVMGSLPHVAQIPEVVDWTFWRHFILRCFYESNEFVRIETDNFRSQMIQTHIRQGQVRGRTPEYRYEDNDEIECRGHTTSDPLQRIIHRDINTQRLLQMVHQSHIICLGLMSHVDKGMASLKIKLDKSRVLQKVRHMGSRNTGHHLKQEEDEDQATGFPSYLPWGQQEPAEESLAQHHDRQLALEDAARYLNMAIDEVSGWRSEVQQAVLETDESIH